MHLEWAVVALHFGQNMKRGTHKIIMCSNSSFSSVSHVVNRETEKLALHSLVLFCFVLFGFFLPDDN